MAATTRIAGLDGLRGLACLAVFAANFHHVYPADLQFGLADFGRFLEGGAGVVILFILSGFLLSIPYWNAIQSNSRYQKAGHFWIKRIARLAPAYLIVLTALVIHNRHWVNPHGDTDIVLHYLFLFNYTDFSFYGINPPFWALGIIAQFYLIFPILFIILKRLKPFTALGFVCLIGISSYAAHVALLSYAANLEPWPFPNEFLSRDGPVFTHSILAHLPHFLMGVVAGYFYALQQTKSLTGRVPALERFDLWFWVCLAGVLVILTTRLEELLQIPNGRYTLPWVPALLALLIYATPRALLTSRLLETYPFRFLGIVSYGVYVYHLPIINLTARLSTRLGWGLQDHILTLAGIAFIITLVVSGCSYYLVERPLLRMTRRLLKA